MIPKKSFGQHFLVDPDTVKKIIDRSGVKTGNTILEIGSGKGILTTALIEKGAKVVAFEVDRDLFAFLKEKFDDKNVEFIFEDFLKFKKDLKVDSCISNIPYNISTPIIKKLFDLEIPEMTLMVQKEYANRILASPKSRNYGSLSVFVQVRARVERLFDVSRESFFPPPKVDSTVLKMIKTDLFIKKIKDMEIFDKIVRKAFAQKRKTIKNNLKDIKEIEMILKDIAIFPNSRAEEVDIDHFIKLSNVLKENFSSSEEKLLPSSNHTL